MAAGLQAVRLGKQSAVEVGRRRGTAQVGVSRVRRHVGDIEARELGVEAERALDIVHHHHRTRRPQRMDRRVGDTLVNVRLTLTWIAGESPAGGKV